jgi:hypothetical protein
MGFASTYLEDKAIFREFIKEAPRKDTGLVIVVPAFDEPEIGNLVDSLALCEKPDCATEVIIVINAPPGAGKASIENNRLSKEYIESWKTAHPGSFKLFTIEINPSELGDWGVGLARKTGMDEAVRRFNSIGKPDGVILNLDADCTVQRNYLTEIYRELYTKKDRSACSIYFEHPLSGNDFPEIVYRSAILYELHLRYYFQALAFTGFPYVHHTVGSVIAVKALAYVRAGGMNRRKAGEDFYFIQKLVPAGGYFNLNTTTVFPSPRCSIRVPFGTGASISRLVETASNQLLTYNFGAFRDLKNFFNRTDDFFDCKLSGLTEIYKELPESIRQFIPHDEWVAKIMEIKGNTGGISSFRKRFFNWVNMFRVVKYLNYTHEKYYRKKYVEDSASELLRDQGIGPCGTGALDLLLFYRELEKKG